MDRNQNIKYKRFLRFVLNNKEMLEKQDTMAIEESLEFSLAILHLRRGKADRTDLVSEIADLENMIGQIKMMHGITEKEVADERMRKIDRKLEEIASKK
jgi:NTP pyrophosphatase (non-canonical NTP hydrolase)